MKPSLCPIPHLVAVASTVHLRGLLFFFLGFLVFAVPFWILIIRLRYAQLQYLRHYRVVRNARLPLSGERGAGVSDLIIAFPERMRALRTPQPERDLETERRHIHRLYRWGMVWLVLGGAIFGGIQIVGR